MHYNKTASEPTGIINTIVPVVLFLVSFTLRYLALNQTRYANGWDGYFYINEVRSFLEEGRMDVPDLSLFYPLSILLQCIVNDYVLAIKIASCLIASSFVVAVFFLAKKWSENIFVAITVSSYCLFSPHLTYFTAQYPKNLLGIVLFLFLLFVLDSKRKWLILLLLIVNFFGHRVTAVLSLVAALLYFGFEKQPKLVVVVVLIFTTSVLTAGFFLPGLLSLFDSERLQGIFTDVPQFAPLSFIQSFGPGLIPPYWFAEIALNSILFVAGIVAMSMMAFKINIDHRSLTLLAILTLLVFPFLRWSIEGPAFRFALIFILLCPLAAVPILHRLKNGYGILIPALIFCCLAFFSYKSYNPQKHDPPYGIYKFISKEITAKVNSSSCGLIIAHKSLAEYLVYATGIDAMSWNAEYKISPAKLWRVAADVKDAQFKYYLSKEDLKFVYRITPTYTFVRENIWVKFLENVKKDGNQELLDELKTWKNPNRTRPAFMLKRK